MSIPIQVTFDAHDPLAMASFWAVALGYVLQPPPAGFVSWDAFADANDIPAENRNDLAAIVDPDGSGPRILFQRVPELKTTKNRVHLDVNAGGGHGVEYVDRVDAVDHHVDVLIDHGATKLQVFGEREYWVVMQDPEGNEFCVQ